MADNVSVAPVRVCLYAMVIFLPAVKEGQGCKAGPLVEVCSPAGNSPYQGTCAIHQLALVEEEGRPGTDCWVHAELL